ncbi:MAG TPA: hypothetical protein VE934_05880 [Polaromonas sp.]|uniref:hypothetical protein n=1 Tax=Polaromonas sp. TaxID=1869339 RepID=UPI002D49CF99|nr:hypothetical protein [Polaromonas sp.]HYW56465.1 hypothetical protein [Polaromonas sp.]
MLRVALLGAQATARTNLAAALLSARPELQVTVIDHCKMLDSLTPGQHSPFDITLLMGLDLPRGGQDAPEAETTDVRLRSALATAGISYKVIYGCGPELLQHALGAVDALVSDQTSLHSRKPWVWTCDTCSDPQCERRLLSDLIAARGE